MNLLVETSNAELTILSVTPDELRAKLQAAVLQVMRECGTSPIAAAASVEISVIPSRAEFAMSLLQAQAQRQGDYR